MSSRELCPDLATNFAHYLIREPAHTTHSHHRHEMRLTPTDLWPGAILRKRITLSSPLNFCPTHRLSATPMSICSTAQDKKSPSNPHHHTSITNIVDLGTAKPNSRWVQGPITSHIRRTEVHERREDVREQINLRPSMMIPPVSELMLQKSP